MTSLITALAVIRVYYFHSFHWSQDVCIFTLCQQYVSAHLHYSPLLDWIKYGSVLLISLIQGRESFIVNMCHTGERKYHWK